MNWPEGLLRIADVIGEELTLKLAQSFGGLKGVHIPKDPTTDNRLAAVVGREAWAKLCERFGGRTLDIPRGHFLELKKDKILALARTDMSTAAIALEVGVTQRYVTMVLSAARSERQLPLFPDS